MEDAFSLTRLFARGLLLVALVASPPLFAETGSFTADLSAITTSRAGLESIVAYMGEYTENNRPSKAAIPSDTDRTALRTGWYAFLDHIHALDGVGERNNRLYHQLHGQERKQAFQLAYAAFLTEYRYALELLNHTERMQSMHTLLNEPMPELGLPAGSYAQVKFRFLNVLRATEFSWLAIKYQSNKIESPLVPLVDEDVHYITAVKTHGGPVLTAKNAGKIASDTMFTAWFPVQKGVSEWMGDTKVLRQGKDLITEAQLKELQPQLQPGDVLLVRHEWYLSNVGLPGYWPHAALYVGSAEERRRFFADKEVQAWVVAQGESSGDIETLLASSYPDNYRLSQQSIAGESPRIVEAISEGVSFTGMKHAAGADSLVVLRPRVAPQVKARAIARAFQMAGRPYDFDFNFLTDAALVCTELVYKAYEGEGGLVLPLEAVMGRPVLPANGIARLFDEEYTKPSHQFDFIAFYDGDERAQRAVQSDVDAFRASAYRPKWHIFLASSSKAEQSAAAR